MNYEYYNHQSHTASPYVEHCQSFVTASLPQTPTTDRNSPHFHTTSHHGFEQSKILSSWPTPSSQPRLAKSNPSHSSHSGDTLQRARQTPSIRRPQLTHTVHSHIKQQQQQSPAVPRQSNSTSSADIPSLSPTAHIFHTPSHQSFAADITSANLHTPPLSAASNFSNNLCQPTLVMDHSRRMSANEQRPLMGPPETPSRGMIPQSPGLFSNINFSPDMFGHQNIMEAQTAPVLPQHRLFWDPVSTTPMPDTPQNFHTPSAYPDDFANSFNLDPNTMPREFLTPHNMPYDLPSNAEPMNHSFIDTTPLFPAPFQTSPRMAPPHIENPTQFLSSPARRFGGEPRNDQITTVPSMPDLPAYHHQLEESKRERELHARQQRRRTRPRRSQVPDQDLVMRSVRRALSPAKSDRPGLTRSATFGGIHSSARRSTSGLDTISLSSTSSHSTRNGRSSPIRRVRNISRRSSANQLISRTSSRASISLAINEDGVACTTMNSLPEHDESDDEMTDDPSDDDQLLYSFAEPPDLPTLDDRSSTVRLSLGSDKVARISRLPPTPSDSRFDPQSTIRRVRGETLTSAGNAQQALRALVLDRSQSTSSHASSSSLHFHSSPPMPHAQLGPFQPSPTTITDPGLNTPSTDAGSHGSNDATRCVCNSSSPDGNIMIQCESCTKWLHAKCVGLTNRNIPDVYVCTFCEQTPVRGGTIRAAARHTSFRQSPLAHKSRRR